MPNGTFRHEEGMSNGTFRHKKGMSNGIFLSGFVSSFYLRPNFSISDFIVHAATVL